LESAVRPKTFDFDMADASLTGFASNVTGAAFVLTASVATDGLAHQVSIRNDAVTDHSGKTVTLVGTDQDGHALTEVVTAPGTSATVESAGYFLTLTSATPSATIGADTFDIGWVDEVSGKVIPLNWRSSAAAPVYVDVTGTINFTVQETFQNVFDAAREGSAIVWRDITALSGKTADAVGAATVGATGIRFVVNSYSSGAEAQMYLTQSDNH
jgi:hypothetical protein